MLDIHTNKDIVVLASFLYRVVYPILEMPLFFIMSSLELRCPSCSSF